MKLITAVSKNRALMLDGNTQYVRLPDQPQLNITGDITIKARVMITGLKAFAAICSRGGGSATDIQWLFTIENGVPKMYASNGSTFLGATPGFALTPFTWYDIVAGFSGNVLRISVEYASYSTLTLSGTRSTYTGTFPVTIGCYSKLPAQFTHQGAIDKIKIWNRALTVAEALADNTTPDTTGLVADYQFENDATCSNDSSLNGTVMANSTTTLTAPYYIGSNSSYSTILQQRLVTSSNRGKALMLNGGTQHVRIADDPKLNITGDLTIKARIMLAGDGATRAFNAICSRGGGTSANAQWLLVITAGTVKLIAGNGTTSATASFSTFTLLPYIWYDIIAGFSGTTLQVSVNYAAYQTVTLSGTRVTYTSSFPVAIGTYSQSPGSFTHNGAVDRVKIWSRALTVAQALADNTTPDTTNLVADYQFEDNANCSNDATLNAFIMASSGVSLSTPYFIGSTSNNSNVVRQQLLYKV